MSQRSPATGLLNLNRRLRFMSTHQAIACTRCGNLYLVLLLREGPDFNDFGLRHCPFCGRLSDKHGSDFFSE